jgi:hypothetical protein
VDTSDYPSLGLLARLNAQLLAHNQAVAAVVDVQLDDIERLFRAATQRDWQAVLTLGEQLVGNLEDRADKPVVRSARKVCNALHGDPSGAKAVRHLPELLAACREAKLRRELPS